MREALCALQFMYLRENDFSRFDPGMMLYNLKVRIFSPVERISSSLPYLLHRSLIYVSTALWTWISCIFFLNFEYANECQEFLDCPITPF